MQKKKKKKKLYILQHETTSILKKKEKRKKRKKEKEEGSTADPPCCGAKPTHGQPPMLRPAMPPIPVGQSQPWVWLDPHSSSPADPALL
jgi:hypothetical protein